MFVSVYQGHEFSYSYEAKTEQYHLFRNDQKSQIYLQGDIAQLFRRMIDSINTSLDYRGNEDKFTEDVISLFV